MPAINPLEPPIPQKTGQRLHWENLQGASLGLALSHAISKHPQPVIIVAADHLLANRLQEEVGFFNHMQHSIMAFPDWETLPYDQFSPHQDIVSDRLSTLSQLSHLKQGAVITSISTLMQQICPPDYLHQHVFIMRSGQSLSLNTTRLQLEKAGYRCVNQVREHGEFAIRGSMMDLFPMGSHTPYRIDLLDEEIDSIRTFSAETQRSIEKVESIQLLPAKEFPLTDKAIELFRSRWRSEFTGNPLNCPMYQDISEGICTSGIEYYLPLFFEKTASFFDYLPSNSLIITVGDVVNKAEEFFQEIQTRYAQRAHDIQRPILKPQQVFIKPDDVFQKVNHFANIRATVTTAIEQPFHTLEEFIQNNPARVLFCAESAGRREILLQQLNKIAIYPHAYPDWHTFFTDTAPYGITTAPLETGLSLTHPAIHLITESQLFGHRVVQQRRRKESVQDPDLIIKDLTELQIGAPIVHIDHGVGRYLGLQTLTVGEQIAEFLTLEYADQTKLYVPVASLHLISRYSGLDPEHAPLHKLGTEQWQRAKRKAAEQVRDVAAELLDIYAKRAARPGMASHITQEDYLTFADAFAFEETPDQARAIEQIMQDMQSDKPMDRLVCGDVGFGKTEVAMRAAFIAVQNNKQVGVLVPTTLLAQQHYQTFQDRFANWPIRIAVVSRFQAEKATQKVIAELESGKIDIIIGTHKLLQEHIQFKSLGLLIIDEEHLFGVQQKERLKALRSNIDILTLTATPIPRTLNMAFSGIRDLSLIATPPARRLAVKTFVHEYQTSIIQEALLREIMRGGQVFFLHNDVATIERMCRDLEKLVPEARVNFAHGQMRERELERVMSDFYHRRFNVLVCSTIIESGIDIPSANTIVINRADKFGLAQLHQLRGRVGRSHHQAYAYLLIPSYKTLTADAEKRLNAISAYEDLGIGFTLATHDLEIRGAGELLGEGQSGNMHAIGFTLYMDLLSRAVDAMKAGKEPEMDLEKSLRHSAEIELQIPALIPEKYLNDVHLRLQCYKRIASAKTSTELDEIQVEMIDRFGLLPEPAKNLFAIALLRQKADSLGIIKIESNAKGGKMEFAEKPNIDPMKIITLIQKDANHFKLEGPTRLRFVLDEHLVAQRVECINKILERL